MVRMLFRKSLLALVLSSVIVSSAAPAAEGGEAGSLQNARTLEAAGRYGDAWEAVDSALASAEGSDRGALEDLRARLSEKTGFLSLRVEPDGAEVFLDGASIGLTPVPALRRVNVGVHEVRVTKAGFEPFVRNVSVAPDGKAVVSTALVRESAVGTLRVRDEGGQPLHVIVDGVDVGATPLEREVSPGKHTVAGSGVDRVAPEREVDVRRGQTVDIVLASRPLAAKVSLKTADGKGVVRVDGTVVGEGAYEGSIRIGVHRLEITRDGRQPWRRDVVLHDGEAFTQEVTLEEPPRLAGTDDGYVPPKAGWYGGFGFLGSLAPLGAQSELKLGCLPLGAASCKITRPLGGGLTFHVGYDFDPVGFELRVSGLGDYWSGEANFDGNVSASGGNPAAAPARKETFDFARVGGTASLQVRGTAKLGFASLTAAVGPGFSYRGGAMVRRATVADSQLAAAYNVPAATDPVAYVSPALTADVGLGLRIGASSWLTLGLFAIVESAGNDFRSSPGLDAVASLAGVQGGSSLDQVPGLPSPSYHFASGTQLLVGPEISLRFGP
jgi:hypothetical protein